WELTDMSFTPPNQTVTGQHVGHSSEPVKGTPADGLNVPGRARAHDGKIQPPNIDVLRNDHVGRSGAPVAPTDGNLGSGAVPTQPFGPSGKPNATGGSKLTDDNAMPWVRNARR